MEEIIKFTEEELQKIKKIQEGYQKKIAEFGELKFTEIELQKRQNEYNEKETLLKSEYADLQLQEQELSKMLNDKYGNGVLNTETGEFTKK